MTDWNDIRELGRALSTTRDNLLESASDFSHSAIDSLRERGALLDEVRRENLAAVSNGIDAVAGRFQGLPIVQELRQHGQSIVQGADRLNDLLSAEADTGTANLHGFVDAARQVGNDLSRLSDTATAVMLNRIELTAESAAETGREIAATLERVDQNIERTTSDLINDLADLPRIRWIREQLEVETPREAISRLDSEGDTYTVRFGLGIKCAPHIAQLFTGVPAGVGNYLDTISEARVSLAVDPRTGQRSYLVSTIGTNEFGEAFDFAENGMGVDARMGIRSRTTVTRSYNTPEEAERALIAIGLGRSPGGTFQSIELQGAVSQQAAAYMGYGWGIVASASGRAVGGVGMGVRLERDSIVLVQESNAEAVINGGPAAGLVGANARATGMLRIEARFPLPPGISHEDILSDPSLLSQIDPSSGRIEGTLRVRAQSSFTKVFPCRGGEIELRSEVNMQNAARAFTELHSGNLEGALNALNDPTTRWSAAISDFRMHGIDAHVDEGYWGITGGPRIRVTREDRPPIVRSTITAPEIMATLRANNWLPAE